jgi:hypothetical protein
LQIDFAVAEENGELVPRLIELQGFASMFSYQVALDRAYRKAGLVPEDVTCYFNGLEEESYLKVLKQIICGDEAAESVILLEIKPELQRTRIDFSCTQEMIGINYKCLSDLYKVGRSLYYKDETGREVQVKRIYNRVIFDELKKTEIDLSFSITDDLDVTWVAHPNWFHRISKHSLPALNDVSVPKSYVIGELESIPDDLENYRRRSHHRRYSRNREVGRASHGHPPPTKGQVRRIHRHAERKEQGRDPADVLLGQGTRPCEHTCPSQSRESQQCQ